MFKPNRDKLINISWSDGCVTISFIILLKSSVAHGIKIIHFFPSSHLI